jgi:antitoxin VapB
MNVQRPIKLLRNGPNQSVEIPREFELPGDEAIMRKEGDKLIIEPATKPKDTLAEWLSTLEPLDEEWPEIEDLPPDPVDL